MTSLKPQRHFHSRAQRALSQFHPAEVRGSYTCSTSKLQMSSTQQRPKDTAFSKGQLQRFGGCERHSSARSCQRTQDPYCENGRFWSERLADCLEMPWLSIASLLHEPPNECAKVTFHDRGDPPASHSENWYELVMVSFVPVCCRLTLVEIVRLPFFPRWCRWIGRLPKGSCCLV